MTDHVPLNQPQSWQYPFDFTATLTVHAQAENPGWRCVPHRIYEPPSSQVPHDGDRLIDLTQLEVDPSLPSPTDSAGVAEAFVDLLRHEALPPVPRFRVMRLVPPPEARWERPVEMALGADHDTHSVVVGERVVVTWVRQIFDTPHLGPTTLAHLDAVNFFDVPETHGILLWTTPSGREVPVAWATKYVPSASDGWDWCVELAGRSMGSTTGRVDPWLRDFPARLGRLTARLHLALATASSVLPEPTEEANVEAIRSWMTSAHQQLDHLESLLLEAHTSHDTSVAEVVLGRVPAIRTVLSQLAEVARETEHDPSPLIIQRIHGDLNVGQILRWPGGLTIVDFHPNPTLAIDDIEVSQPRQPAARDVARLLRSLDHVARVADARTSFTHTQQADEWSQAARTELLQAYTTELAVHERSEIFAPQLLAAFETEQTIRDLTYALQQSPAWVYAPLGGLLQEFPQTTVSTRGKHA